ncbi:MAG: exodeoxyribonuclease VII large subunit [Abditibacteriales bacterium]|nr:exodeoxyribonuclease VII large subunit [Abditibacteriales bacterium]MDW8367858.1 exodeoxyribonuclease VII large subunit [Abditibacteriales bacterium]
MNDPVLTGLFASRAAPAASHRADEPSCAVLTVSEVTRHIKRLLEEDATLMDVQVRGEISNFKRHTSGHMYFTLKDTGSQLRCVMFRRDNAALRFQPEDGARVVARGYISVYEARGDYQLYVSAMSFDGVGALFEAFERLKKRLQEEGLFDVARKRPLPRFVQCVGIATSPTGAALRDMITIIRRRSPGTRILVIPCLVQGADAPPDIVRAIEWANRCPDIDVLIVGRGGGSLEDLWAFNDEAVARAVFHSRIPVVSAVGHETDFTISDFVADLRAPTPSAAAELVTVDVREWLAAMENFKERLTRALSQKVEIERQALQGLLRRRVMTHPQEHIDYRRQLVDDLCDRAARGIQQSHRWRTARLQTLMAKLQALDPHAVLARGYAVFRDARTKQTITSAVQAPVGREAEVVLKDGCVTVQVKGR